MRVYVAGPYSCDPMPDAFSNMRRGVRASVELFLDGHTPFSPWLDWMYWMVLADGEDIPKERIYEYSLDWLEVCDCVYVLSGWERSPGTQNEIKWAKKLEIPVFFAREDFDAWVRAETGE